MKIASHTQHRALGFIDSCVRSGYRPLVSEIQAWLSAPEARAAVVENFFTNLVRFSIAVSAGSRVVSDAEDTIDHLIRIKWIAKNDGRVTLTDLGRALFRSAERSEVAEEDPVVLVLDSEDPFAYAKVIGHLARAGAGFLVDPYFRLEQLRAVLGSTSITRVLISKQYKHSNQIRSELTIALDSPSLPRPIEVRASASGTLHDRLIVGENGDVWILGASLNSIGTVNSVIAPIPSEGAIALRASAEDLWASAEPVRSAPAKPQVDRPREST